MQSRMPGQRAVERVHHFGDGLETDAKFHARSASGNSAQQGPEPDPPASSGGSSRRSSASPVAPAVHDSVSTERIVGRCWAMQVQLSPSFALA